jgi:DNA repair protein RecO (recombination protein O)
MRPSHATPAIVLRSQPYGESDKIVSFLTPSYGKFAGVAKGALRSQRRFMNSLAPFALVNLRFQDRPGSNLVFILGSELVVGFKNLAISLERISCASYMVEITEGLVPERDESFEVFEHLRDGLRYVEENGTSLRFLTTFELKLLKLAGYQPIWNRCKGCGQAHVGQLSRQWHISPVDGGILCDTCSRSSHVSIPLCATSIRILTALQTEAHELQFPLVLPLSVINEVRLAVTQFIQFYIDKEIKSAPFLQRFPSV